MGSIPGSHTVLELHSTLLVVTEIDIERNLKGHFTDDYAMIASPSLLTVPAVFSLKPTPYTLNLTKDDFLILCFPQSNFCLNIQKT